MANGLDKEEQLFILGTWGRGQLREDIPNIPRSFFDNSKLYDAIVEGRSLEEIRTEGIIDWQTYNDMAEGEPIINYQPSRDKAYRLRLSMAIRELHRGQHRENARDLLNEVEKALALCEGNAPIKKDSGLLETFQETIKERETEQIIKYGFTDLDKATNGIHRKQLITIAGRPGAGKSAFALQVADNVRKQGHKVLFFPLEMSTNENIERLLIREQLITTQEAQKGHINEEKLEKVKEYINNLEHENTLIFYEARNKLEEIITAIKTEKPAVAIIDQLTQVRPRGNFDQVRTRFMEVTNTLKNLALRENVAIIVLSQINRVGAEKSSLETLAESDTTGQDSDVVLGLDVNKDSLLEEGRTGQKQIDLEIIKQRNGRSHTMVTLMYKGAEYSFRNYDFTGIAKREYKNIF